MQNFDAFDLWAGYGAAEPVRPAAEGVAQLLRRITSALAAGFSSVKVTGEIHSISRAPSGHIYFDLKDAREEAHISCALFRGAASRLDFVPARGDSVVAEGEINIYAPRGQMNLVVKRLKRAGEGDLYARFLALKEKLLAEGLFDVSRKKALPLYPRRIGIVTSPEAAALRDAVRTILLAGAAVDIILYPARVQGEGALAELCAALRDADFRAECDVILLVRGGGSLADLWTYNEETLARVIAELHTPVISGVGHETDTTIADLVADFRAATPTAAAAKAMENWKAADGVIAGALAVMKRSLRETVMHALYRAERASRLERLFERQMENAERRLDYAVSRVAGLPVTVFAQKEKAYLEASARLIRARPAFDAQSLTLARLSARLEAALQNQVPEKRLALTALTRRLADSLPDVTLMRTELAGREALLKRLIVGETGLKRERQTALTKRLKALAPEAVLSRGYALAVTDKGEIVRDAAKLTVGESLTVRFARGEAVSRVVSTAK